MRQTIETPRWTPEALQEWAAWEAHGDSTHSTRPQESGADRTEVDFSATQQRWLDLNA